MIAVANEKQTITNLNVQNSFYRDEETEKRNTILRHPLTL